MELSAEAKAQRRVTIHEAAVRYRRRRMADEFFGRQDRMDRLFNQEPSIEVTVNLSGRRLRAA